jgi:transposase InsO family protein
MGRSSSLAARARIFCRPSDRVLREDRPSHLIYSETFIGRFGDELLKREVFASLLEAKVLVEDYRNHYNQRRPHSALGYRTPAEVAASCGSASVEMALTKELQSVTTLS